MAIMKKKDVAPMAKASKPPVKTTPSTPGMKRALGVDSVESGKMYPFKKKAAAPKMKATTPGMKKALGVDSVQAGKSYPFTKEAITRRDSAKSSNSAKPVKVLKSSFKEVPTKRVPVKVLKSSFKEVSKVK